MIAWIATGVIVYLGGVLFLARMMSDKWHPDARLDKRT